MSPRLPGAPRAPRVVVPVRTPPTCPRWLHWLRAAALRSLALCPVLTGACGHGGGVGSSTPGPFEIEAPFTPPAGGGGVTPPPSAAGNTLWNADAAPLGRVATFGSFPGDLSLMDETLFVNDADQIEQDGATIVALDASGAQPFPSARYASFHLAVDSLIDASGQPADLAQPIGFGFYVNDVEVVAPDLGFLLVNAGGTDSPVALSNLVVFDPSTGVLRQVLNLAHAFTSPAPLVDSAGTAAVGGTFVQSQAESLVYVPDASGDRLYVAMANILVGAPGFGTERQRGTLQVYDVRAWLPAPVTARPAAGQATETLLTQDYNPVALALIWSDPSIFGVRTPRLLVTCGGTTGYDANFRLVPTGPASVEVFDALTAQYRGRFRLGLAGLAGTPPALGNDAVGHRIGFFPSSTTGEVYLLRLDGLHLPDIDVTALAVLRAPGSGIPVTAAAAGGPGGNLAGVGLAPDGRALVVSGFGDLFQGAPGRLALLNLPDDLVSGSTYGPTFIPGSTLFATVPGRTLGPIIVRPGAGVRPDAYVLVGGTLDPATFLGNGAGSVGTLTTAGLIR